MNDGTRGAAAEGYAEDSASDASRMFRKLPTGSFEESDAVLVQKYVRLYR